MFNVVIFGIIVLLIFCSKAEVLPETLLINKFVVNTPTERMCALELAFPSHAFSVSVVPDKCENEVEREE